MMEHEHDSAGNALHARGEQWLHQIPQFGEPLPQIILTGGDPLIRSDLHELIGEAKRLGIGVSITPAAIAALTRDNS